MSRARADGRSRGEARHVRLYHWMMQSPAWASLTAVERSVYVQIAVRFTGTNNGTIGCSVRDLSAELHLGKTTIERALGVLIRRGFIVRTRRGVLTRSKVASEYELTEHANNLTGALASKTFMRWRPEI